VALENIAIKKREVQFTPHRAAVWRDFVSGGASGRLAVPLHAKFVILSEAKNPSSIQVRAKTRREILRFAQNDSVLRVVL